MGHSRILEYNCNIAWTSALHQMNDNETSYITWMPQLGSCTGIDMTLVLVFLSVLFQHAPRLHLPLSFHFFLIFFDSPFTYLFSLSFYFSTNLTFVLFGSLSVFQSCTHVMAITLHQNFLRYATPTPASAPTLALI